MAQRHQRSPDGDGVRAPKHTVGQPAPAQRRHIHKPRIEPENRARERLRRQRPIEILNGMGKRREAPHLADILRLEEIFGHIEHEQRLHAVIGKPLPNLRHGKPAKPRRVADKRGLAFGAFLKLLQRGAHRRPAFDLRRHGKVFGVLDFGSVHARPRLFVSVRPRRRLAVGVIRRRHDPPTPAPRVTRSSSSCANVSSVPQVLPEAMAASRASFEG